MSLLDPTLPAELPARLRQEAARTCDRLRSMSLVRLGATMDDGRSRGRAALDLAQELADEAAGIAARPARRLPDLPEPTAGDVLAVCVNDLAEELDAVPPDAGAATCRSAVERLVALRQLL